MVAFSERTSPSLSEVDPVTSRNLANDFSLATSRSSLMAAELSSTPIRSSALAA